MDPRTVEITFWIITCTSLAGVIGHETNWGRNFNPIPPKISYAPANFLPPNLSVAPHIDPPEMSIEMVERPLFVFTRRPPPPAALVAPTIMKKGQYKLAGVTIVESKKIAFLIEMASGKTRTIAEGQNIGEITVSSVEPDRVRLTQGNEEEFVILKIEPTKSLPVAAKTSAPSDLSPPPKDDVNNSQGNVAPPPPVAKAEASNSKALPLPQSDKPKKTEKNEMSFESIMRKAAQRPTTKSAEKPSEK